MLGTRQNRFIDALFLAEKVEKKRRLKNNVDFLQTLGFSTYQIEFSGMGIIWAC